MRGWFTTVLNQVATKIHQYCLASFLNTTREMEEKIEHFNAKSKGQETFRIELGSVDCVVRNGKSKDKVRYPKTDLDKTLKYQDESACAVGLILALLVIFIVLCVFQDNAIRDYKVQLQTAENSIFQCKYDMKGQLQSSKDQIDSIKATHAKTRDLLRAAEDSITQYKNDIKKKDEFIQSLLKREEELRDYFVSIEALDDDDDE